MHGLLLMAARAIAALARGTRGTILPLFAICLFAMAFATGMSIDYAKAMRMQTKLNAAADAAALAAVSKQIMDLPTRYNLPSAYSPEVGRQAAVKMFGITANPLAASGRIKLDTNDPLQFSVLIVDNAAHTSRTATVRYRGTSPNVFARLLGVSALTIKGNAVSTVTASAYTDIYLALDTSQSMGLAATDEDARKLWQGTNTYNHRSCQFGCHVPAPGETYANDWVAKQVGATLRVDVLRDAVTDMVDTAKSSEGNEALYRFGLYRIGQSTSDIAALTDDLASIRNSAQSITLGPNDSSGVGDTNLVHATDYVFPKVASHGDGSSRSNARAFLFLVTDGVIDTKGGCTYGHCTAPIDPATCQRYKDANIVVGVVYTTYLPVKADPTNPNDPTLRDEYRVLVQPFADRIAPNLKACASDGWFLEASDGPSIHAAMQRLFAQAIQTPILTR